LRPTDNCQVQWDGGDETDKSTTWLALPALVRSQRGTTSPLTHSLTAINALANENKYHLSLSLSLSLSLHPHTLLTSFSTMSRPAPLVIDNGTGYTKMG
jgi:hypothetical protein